MKKRLIAGLLSVLMVFSLCSEILPHDTAAAVDTRATANNQQQINPDADGGTAGKAPVVVSKTVSPTEKENYFDITLSATDEELISDNSTDVVLVMDISNTMNTNGRIGNAKNAAVSFMNQLAEATNRAINCRVGLVTFNTNANVAFALTDAYIRTGIPVVNNLTAPATPDEIKYTNIEGGLLLGQAMLSTSPAKHKFIILITDGFPTTYTKTRGAQTMTGWNVYNNNHPSYNPDEDGKPAYEYGNGIFYDYVTNMACIGTSYSNTAAQKARDAAADIKEDGINIYSIGIDIGGQTVKQYVDRGLAGGFSIVERRNTTYEIESVNGSYEDWLGRTIGGGDAFGEDSAYHSGNNSQELANAFDQVLTYIKAYAFRAMHEALVTSDPMGSHVEFLGFYDKNGSFTAKNALTGSNAANGENTASYTSKITWDIQNSGYTKKTVDGKTTYTYQIKYRIRLENDLNDFVENRYYDTNGTTKLTYKTPEGDPGELEYPVPEVKGYLTHLEFTKQSAAGAALAGAEFSLPITAIAPSATERFPSLLLTAPLTAMAGS